VLYNVVNVVSAAVWAVAIGVGGYYVGPPILDVVDDLGTVGIVLSVVVVVVGVVAALVRRQRGAVRRTAEREGASS
jgi:membrane protein DedA with SNARE-associated domain